MTAEPEAHDLVPFHSFAEFMAVVNEQSCKSMMSSSSKSSSNSFIE